MIINGKVKIRIPFLTSFVPSVPNPATYATPSHPTALMESSDSDYFPFLYKIAELNSNHHNPRSAISYELRELRWTPDYGETSMLTSRASMNRYWYFKIPSVYVDFGHVDRLASDDVLNCEYKLSWSQALNGVVYKRCASSGERIWKPVGRVISGNIGLEFLSTDGSGRHQAIATKYKYDERRFWYR
jgi:hypothetical protein